MLNTKLNLVIHWMSVSVNCGNAILLCASASPVERCGVF